MSEQERRERIARSINTLHAYQDIQNEMGRVVAAFNYRQADKILERFALHLDDVSLEYADEGLFRGPDAVETIVRETVGRTPRPGEMYDVHLTTPVIEVAEDEQTAKAIWWAPGAASLLDENAEPSAVWMWGTIAADFIRVDDSWLIYHLHYFTVIKSSYDKGWVEDTDLVHRANTPLHPKAQSSTHHNPYTPTSVRDALPAVPRPYADYDGPGWMLERDKTK